MKRLRTHLGRVLQPVLEGILQYNAVTADTCTVYRTKLKPKRTTARQMVKMQELPADELCAHCGTV